MINYIWKLAAKIKLGAIWIKSGLKEYKRWTGSKPDNSRIRVYYGYDHLPTRADISFGGIVKTQDLEKMFENSKKNANILYLISSGLPLFSVRMAKLAINAGVKLVINQNGVAYPGWHGKGWERTNKPMKQLIHMSDHVIYQSRFCKLSADKYLGKCHEPHYDILYNPVDTCIFIPKKFKNKKKIILLLSGSHWTKNRVLVALDTLQIVRKNNKNVFLLIAGRFCWHEDESVCYHEVKNYSKKLKISDYLKYKGIYTQNQAPSLMQQCSILLHTKYNDPCPRVVVEAMACGIPIVYSATGGVPELVGKDAGVGVSGPLDWEKDHPPLPEKLAFAVNKVIDNLERFSNYARLRAVQKFDVKFWLTRHKEIFNKLLE